MRTKPRPYFQFIEMQNVGNFMVYYCQDLTSKLQSLFTHQYTRQRNSAFPNGDARNPFSREMNSLPNSQFSCNVNMIEPCAQYIFLDCLNYLIEFIPSLNTNHISANFFENMEKMFPKQTMNQSRYVDFNYDNRQMNCRKSSQQTL